MDLGEIMGVLAEKALAHVGEMEVRITIKKPLCEPGAVMEVDVKDRVFRTLSSKEYTIVESLKDCCDVEDETIGDALVVLEKLEVERRATEEAIKAAEGEQAQEEVTPSDNE